MYHIKNLTFTYPKRECPALDGIDLTITKGEFVTLCGPSGCGKTTLLRHLKPSSVPHGIRSGSVFFNNTPLVELSAHDAAARIGFVTQSPDNQIVTDKVWHELAFGLESLGLKTPEIRLRVAEMASFFGIQAWFHKSVTELSGGQKKILALASIMVMQPTALILDEPTSQLDPIAASEFLNALGKLNAELGLTVIITEQRLEEAFPLSSRAIVMENGRVIADGTPKGAALQLLKRDDTMFLAMPTPMRVWAAARLSNEELGVRNEECPITVREGAEWLRNEESRISLPVGQAGKKECTITPNSSLLIPNSSQPAVEMSAVEMSEVWFKYDKNLPDVLKGLSFKANYGEITAILGGNGTGKTTALSLAAGLYAPYRGKIKTDNTVYTLPQNAQSLFVAKTVREDLLEMLSGQKIQNDEKQRRLNEIIKLCRLETLLDIHPYDLSGGEQQRAALAKVLLLQPKILLLDEPTKGFDAEFKQVFAAILRKLAEMGAAVIIASHDVEFCAEYADRCALFFDGGIVTENTTHAFFTGNCFYTTAANRMARDILPDAVTAGDIILALGGSLPPVRKNPDERFFTPFRMTGGQDKPNEERSSATPRMTGEQDKLRDERFSTPFRMTGEPQQAAHKKRKSSKRAIIAALMILIVIPITIYLGRYFFGDRSYYYTSLLIILWTMIPFALMFENRKPQARELVIIAVLCAIAVAGRAAFFMLPQFKPVIALVIIAGVAFGGESGFLVGAMTGFVSNFFFAQGPWTPYQMFAFGLIGFLAGVLFSKGFLCRKPIILAIFGALVTFVIYGGIMNPVSVMIWQSNESITWVMLLAAYLQGIPFDIAHASATAIILLIIAKPMLGKLDRVKEKYGLIRG